ncbi:MAG: flagellar export protein FliJ [Gammaproteobacteria bacterium]|nr:flagellar export protein FliJ [Gammaproteobacteria bacterium]MBQ0839529.1 flagellar export protein FliJ [Gammaproteobacteria bacterium]
MTKIKRFQQLEKMAEHACDKAGRELGQAQESHSKEQAQLEQLTGFFDEYSQRFNNAGATGMNARQLGDFRAFFSQLDNAIEAQRQTLVDLGAQVTQRQTQWVEKHQRTQSLSQALVQVQREQLLQRNKREQKEQDERSGVADRGGWG